MEQLLIAHANVSETEIFFFIFFLSKLQEKFGRNGYMRVDCVQFNVLNNLTFQANTNIYTKYMDINSGLCRRPKPDRVAGNKLGSVLVVLFVVFVQEGKLSRKG